jgi:hypothetical protein
VCVYWLKDLVVVSLTFVNVDTQASHFHSRGCTMTKRKNFSLKVRDGIFLKEYSNQSNTKIIAGTKIFLKVVIFLKIFFNLLKLLFRLDCYLLILIRMQNSYWFWLDYFCWLPYIRLTRKENMEHRVESSHTLFYSRI